MLSDKLALLKNNKMDVVKAKITSSSVSRRMDYYEFIPYYAHFNPHTLMTKDGELVQVIKIDANILGQKCENLDGLHETVRDTIRQAILRSDLSEKIGFWIHVVRKRRPMSYNAEFVEKDFSNSFAGYVNTQWEKNNDWKFSYYNEIYITLMHDGQVAPLLNKNLGNKAMFPKYNRQVRNKYLDELQVRMDALSTELLKNLSENCMARRLSLYEVDIPAVGGKATSIFYSELLEFYGNIFNLRPEKFPLPDVNLSFALQTCDLEFGFNVIEAKSKLDASSRYAAMLSLKQFRDMPAETIDMVLQTPIEMVISQSFVVMPNAKALKHYYAQKELFEMSEDISAIDKFGITEMLACDHKGTTDFGEQQINIMVMADDMTRLSAEVGTFQKVFSELGLVLVREDIRLEEAFWAQFPGNFEFVRRKDTVGREKVAGFCRLNRFHEGSMNNNHWGQCVSLIPTSVGSPYAFNFHDRDNGHSVIFDFNSFEDKAGKILQYFLLTQTRKFNARLVIFDRDQSARLLLNKLGVNKAGTSNYYTMTQLLKVNRDRLEDKSPRLALNPFSLADTKYNQSFLAAWCGLLLPPDVLLSDEQKTNLRMAVAELYTLEIDQRNLQNMVAIVARSNADLAELLNKWLKGGTNAGLFDHEQDLLDINKEMLAFDLTPAIVNPAFLLPLFSYLMHRVIGSIDDSPTIIVLNEAWDLLENNFFAPRLESLLEMLRERNVMVLFTTSNPKKIIGTSILPTIMASSATKIYVPDEMPLEYPSQELEINNQDAFLLLDMNRPKGDFLVKQRGESISLQMSLLDAEDATTIFCNDIKALSSAHGRFAAVPQDY
jgi:type IV secretion system protein VirB4